MATYDRPVEATLTVVLANGESWEATKEDLERFGVVRRLDAYAAFERWWEIVIGRADPRRLPAGGVVGAELNPVRYLVECAVMGYGHSDADMDDTINDAATAERDLRDFRTPKAD